MQSNQDSELNESGLNLAEVDQELEKEIDENVEEITEELTPGLKEIYHDEKTGEVVENLLQHTLRCFFEMGVNLIQNLNFECLTQPEKVEAPDTHQKEKNQKD